MAKRKSNWSDRYDDGPPPEADFSKSSLAAGVQDERERVRGVLREMLADWPQWGAAYDAVNYIAEQLGISLDGGER